MSFEHKDPANWVIEVQEEFEKIRLSTKITTKLDFPICHTIGRILKGKEQDQK
jgi:hypothetical protein